MNNKNIVLSLEGSSAGGFSISVFCKEKLLQEDFYYNSQLSELLLPAIDKILKKNNISKYSLSALFATSGPGSFTCIRVVLSSLIAISLGLNIPLYTIDSLKAAALITKEYPIAIALKAYKKEFYTAFFEEKNLQKTSLVVVMKPEIFLQKIKNKNYCIIGNGISWLQEEYNFIPHKNQKIIVGNYLKSSRVAEYLFGLENKEQYRNSDPIYIKKPDTRLPYQ